MVERPWFDMIKASARLEKLCSELVARQGDGVVLEWLKLGEAHRHGMGLHWRMRKVVCGRYLDAHLSCVSLQALAWLGHVESNGAERASWDGAFDEDVHSLMRVIVEGLKRPLDDWSTPEFRRQDASKRRLGVGSARGARARHRHELLGDLRGLRVLVVDDEAGSLLHLASVLEAAGARVDSAPDAARARQAIDVQTPNLMIAALWMAHEDGYSLMESIRNLPSREKRRIPSIALGAFMRASDVARACRAGFDMHLAKPIQPRALTRAVAQLAMPAIVLG